MEVLGLALAFPAVFIANLAYAALARFLLSRMQRPQPWIRWASSAVVALLVVDVVLVATAGAISARRALGPTYWGLHLVVVFVGAPAVANLLLVPGGRSWYQRWYVVVILCYILGMSLVFFQVAVGDDLFGPDGVGGPFATKALNEPLHPTGPAGFDSVSSADTDATIPGVPLQRRCVRARFDDLQATWVEERSPTDGHKTMHRRV